MGYSRCSKHSCSNLLKVNKTRNSIPVTPAILPVATCGQWLPVWEAQGRPILSQTVVQSAGIISQNPLRGPRAAWTSVGGPSGQDCTDGNIFPCAVSGSCLHQGPDSACLTSMKCFVGSGLVRTPLVAVTDPPVCLFGFSQGCPTPGWL